jgi:tripartite-type tricarboxylate transporter receptor subunit TctC
MKLPRRQFLHLAAGMVALSVSSANIIALTGHDALAQTTRTIKIVIPYQAGGPTDTMSRLLAEQIGRTHGLTVVVESRPGAGTVIATEAVSRAQPDGNTVLIVGNSFVINPHVRKLTYDPLTSFAPICYLVQSPGVVAVNSASTYRTLDDLIAAARAKPGELTMAASGPATGFQIGFELLKRAANINMIFVPFAGSVPAINALLGDHVVAAFGDYTPMSEQLKAGRLRALAVATRTRSEALPEVPTVAEFGFKDYEADIWYGLVAPARTSKETLSQLANWLTAALREPDVRAKLVAVGLYPVGSCGTDFGAHLRKEYEAYGRVIRESNIKAE